MTERPPQTFSEAMHEEMGKHLRIAMETGKLKGAFLTSRTHPELVNSIHRLAQEAGLERTPHVLVLDELPGGAVWSRKIPNAAALPGFSTLLISKSLMEHTGSSLSRGISPELKAVISHEFGHLKHDKFMKVLSLKTLPYTAPIIAMAALHIYEKAQKKAKDKAKEITLEHINTAAEEEKRDEKAKPSGHWEIDPRWHNAMVDAGRYALAGLLGFGLGLAGAHAGSMHAEYRADAFAVTLTKDPELVKRMLTNLYKDNKWDLEAKQMETRHRVRLKERGWLEQFKDSLSNYIYQHTNAHPTLNERLSHVDRVAAEQLAPRQQGAATPAI